MSVSTVQSARSGNFLGYVYLGDNWYDSLTPVNIGDDVYGAFLKNDGWATLGNVDGNVEIVKGVGDSSEIWHFVRQDDGSYVIYNCKDNKVLDVTNADTTRGTNVQMCSRNGNDAQKWYIYGPWSGEYIFKTKLCGKVLDVSNNSSEVGTNVQIWDYNATNAQKFAIYTLEKAGASSISVNAGNTTKKTNFTWTAGNNANKYSLRIKKGTEGNVTSYKDVWNLTDTNYSLVLPAGYYEVYVDSCNSFSYSASNVVKFYVKSCADIDDDGDVSIQDVTLIQKYLAGMNTFTDEQKSVADVSGDGAVSIEDATQIQKYIAGIITELG
jgi:hypothetical protein